MDRDFTYMVDIEPQRNSDGEITAALALYERVHRAYSRSYDIVMGDALYSCQSIWKSVLANGKQIITVLKDNCKTFLDEATKLMEHQAPVMRKKKSTIQEIREVSDCASWWDNKTKICVVSCRDTKTIKRQLTGEVEEVVGKKWFWASSFSVDDIDVFRFVDIARKRWTIENEGFNALVTNWHADHVYRHEDRAFENFSLLTILAANIFQIFYHRNLKPARRKRTTTRRVLNLIMAGIDAEAIVANDTS